MRRSYPEASPAGSPSSNSGTGKSRSCFQLMNRIVEEDHYPQQQQQPDDLEVSNLYLNNSERLVLPRKGSMAKLDEYLCRIPHVVSRAGEVLMETDCSSLHDAKVLSSQRCLNVLQGEVAHVSAQQADVVVSAEATTCHVVAVRSTRSESVPLVSLAHVDQVYDACLENMVKEHIEHHRKKEENEDEEDEMFGFFMEDSDDENDVQQPKHHETSLESSQQPPSYLPGLSCDRKVSFSMPDLHVIPADDDEEEPIEMELHMVGGYLDKEGTSQKLSTALIERFNELAHKYRRQLKISLSTAAISSLNTTADPKAVSTNTAAASQPCSRGLGIDTRTGQVFSVKKPLPAHLEGPALEVRQARAFCPQPPESLSVIHDKMCVDGEIRIQPFQYTKQEELNVLLTVPDDVLLAVTSTSPDHESAQFCTNFRRTLSFVNTVPPESVFENNRPLVYARSSSNLNDWEEKQENDSTTTTSPAMFWNKRKKMRMQNFVYDAHK